jgi:hypothetical protein
MISRIIAVPKQNYVQIVMKIMVETIWPVTKVFIANTKNCTAAER